MAASGDPLAVMVAFGVDSSVYVSAATVCSNKGAGVGAVSLWATPMGVVCIASCAVAAARARLAGAKALC